MVADRPAHERRILHVNRFVSADEFFESGECLNEALMAAVLHQTLMPAQVAIQTGVGGSGLGSVWRIKGVRTLSKKGPDILIPYIAPLRGKPVILSLPP